MADVLDRLALLGNRRIERDRPGIECQDEGLLPGDTEGLLFLDLDTVQESLDAGQVVLVHDPGTDDVQDERSGVLDGERHATTSLLAARAEGVEDLVRLGAILQRDWGLADGPEVRQTGEGGQLLFCDLGDLETFRIVEDECLGAQVIRAGIEYGDR